MPLKNNVTRRRWPHLRVYEALACPLLIPCTGGGSFHLALVQPNIQWPKGEEGVGSRTGTSGAELSNNKMQSFRENASNGWRRKSRVQRAPRCQRGGRQAPKCPSAMHLVLFWKQEKIPEGGKTNHWIKPWPAAPPAKPVPLLRARRIPELNAIKPEFQRFLSSSREIRLPVWVRILSFSPHKTEMVPLPVPARSSPCILRLMLGSPWHGQRLQVPPASRRLHSPSSPANSI